MAVWIVLLEADVGSPETVDDKIMRQVLAAVAGHSVGLHCEDRCAVQLELSAEDPADALRTALTRWRDAVARFELRGWNLVRTEVLTRTELAREIETHGDMTGRVECLGEEDRPPGGIGDGEGIGEETGEDLFHRLFSDPLTGLATPEVFWSRLERALAKDDDAHAVVCLEVDGVRGLDSRFKGTAAEQVLVAVAERVCGAVRADDFVAHLGSDAFGILIESSSEQTATAIAERVLEEARAGVSVGGQEFVPQVRAGLVLTQPGDTPDAVMGYADMALSAAQASGRGHIEVFRSGGRWPAGERSESRVTGTHDRLGYLLLLQEATVATNEAATLEDAAEVMLGQICAHTGWAVGRLSRAAPDTPGELVPPSVWRLPTLDRYRALGAATGKATPLSVLSVTREVLVSGRPGHVTDLEAAPEPAAEALVTAGLRGAFVAPVLVGQEVAAVLEFFADEPIDPEPSLVEVVTAIGIQLGRVVERTRAREVLQGRARPPQQGPRTDKRHRISGPGPVAPKRG